MTAEPNSPLSSQKRHARKLVCLFVWALVGSGLTLPAAFAQNVSGWTVTKNRDGRARASLFSSNFQTVGSGAIVYHPQLEVTCKPTRGKVWRTAILLRSSLSGGRTLRVRIKFDNDPAMPAEWTVDEGRDAVYVDGPQTLARISSAKTLTVSWSKGLFSGSGQAVFNLGDAASKLSEVAASCDVPPPTGSN